MTIKIAELNPSQLSEKELTQVVGGFSLTSIEVFKLDSKLTSYNKSFIGQNANNNSHIVQLGGLVNVATVQQEAANVIM